MKLETTKRYGGLLRHAWLLPAMLLIAIPLSARTVRLYVANRVDSTVSVIDPVTNKVIQVIEGLTQPHGISFSPDGSRVYITDESEHVLAVVDQKTGKIIKKVPLSGYPNTLVVTNDGGRVFVAIRQAPGALDVIDTTSLNRVRSIPMKAPMHDIYLTHDGKYVVAGSVEGMSFKVVDVQTEEIVWEVKFERQVRTMAIESNPDGSARRIFVSLGAFATGTRLGFHGFAVVDFATRKEVTRIKLPGNPGLGIDTPESICHGIGVAPDGKTLWVNSKPEKGVFVYSLPDLKLQGYAYVGRVPGWIAFSPDTNTAYEPDRGDNVVRVIDMTTRLEVARIATGLVPEEIDTLVIP